MWCGFVVDLDVINAVGQGVTDLRGGFIFQCQANTNTGHITFFLAQLTAFGLRCVARVEENAYLREVLYR